jgi:hypothetical protein
MKEEAMFDNRKVLSAVLAASMSTMLIPAAAFAQPAQGAESVTGETAAVEALSLGGGFRFRAELAG